MKKCGIKGCDRKFYGNGMCAAHYMRLKRTGSSQDEIPIVKIKLSMIDRFNLKVSSKNENGCMNWIGCVSQGRYGAFITGSRKNGTRKRYTAHRLSYELFIGKIPAGMCVLHKCDNVKCVNPEHLFLGTQSDNMKDMIKKGRDFHVSSIGSKHGNAKLNEDMVREIKIKLKKGYKYSDLAFEYNVSKTVIGVIKRGKGWKHVEV